MPKKKTIEQQIAAIEWNVKHVVRLQKTKECGTVRLSKAQVKSIWRSLNMMSLYLAQPESVRQTQVQKIFETRNTLEAEYLEQVGTNIDQP